MTDRIPNAIRMNRLLRFALALTLVGAIATQIPSHGTVAIADDTYGGSGGGGTRTLLQGTLFSLIGYGIYATATGVGAVAAAGAATGVSSAATAAGAAASVPAAANSTATNKVDSRGAVSGDSVWDVTKKTSDLTTFATISEKAGWKEKLRAPGNYTAFVPTNAAFRALDPQVLQDLLKDENKAKLADIIGFHVISAKLTLDQMKVEVAKAGTDGLKLTSLTGKTLILTDEGGLKINGVPVVEREIPATNGVIYTVASVLIPMQ